MLRDISLKRERKYYCCFLPMARLAVVSLTLKEGPRRSIQGLYISHELNPTVYQSVETHRLHEFMSGSPSSHTITAACYTLVLDLGTLYTPTCTMSSTTVALNMRWGTVSWSECTSKFAIWVRSPSAASASE